MYVILPFAYLAIRGEKRYRSLVLWVLSVTIALGTLLLIAMLPMPAQNKPWLVQRISVIIYAPCFLSGAVAFDLVRHRNWQWKLPAWIWPLGIFGAVVLYGPHDDAIILSKLIRAWWISIALGILFANVREVRPNWTNSIFHWIAEHSYGIYLSHSIVFWIVFFRMAQFSPWVQIPALIAGSIGIPALLYVSIEKPLIATGGNLARRILEFGN
jgi:peptidoglycan/LPS O-acetylase OafA/YrhL